MNGLLSRTNVPRRYWIRAIGLFCLLLLSSCERQALVPEEPDTIPPRPPAGLFVDEAQDGYIVIAWTRNTEPDLRAYYIYRSEPGMTGPRVIDSTIQNYYIDERRSYDTTYTFHVTAVDRSGNESPASNSVTAESPNISAPDPPRGLLVTGYHFSADTMIHLEWRPNTESDLAGYDVYRSISPGVTAEPQFHVARTEHAFLNDMSGIQTNVRYYYTITAVDVGGMESTPSGVSSDIVLDVPLLIAPLPGAPVSAPPQLSWSAVLNAAAYQVFVSRSPTGDSFSSWTVSPSSDQTCSTVYRGLQLSIGRVYYWKVSAFSQSGGMPNAISETRAFQVID